MRWETKRPFDGKLCLEYLYQKLLKSDNWFLSYSRKCRGCFRDTVYIHFCAKLKSTYSLHVYCRLQHSCKTISAVCSEPKFLNSTKSRPTTIYLGLVTISVVALYTQQAKKLKPLTEQAVIESAEMWRTVAVSVEDEVGDTLWRSSVIVPSLYEPAVQPPTVVMIVVDRKTCRVWQTGCLTLQHVSYAGHRLWAKWMRTVQRTPTTYSE